MSAVVRILYDERHLDLFLLDQKYGTVDQRTPVEMYSYTIHAIVILTIVILTHRMGLYQNDVTDVRKNNREHLKIWRPKQHKYFNLRHQQLQLYRTLHDHHSWIFCLVPFKSRCFTEQPLLFGYGFTFLNTRIHLFAKNMFTLLF